MNTITINDVLSLTGGTITSGDELLLDAEVVGVTEDSRKITPGYIFVAIAGEHVDGHDYIKSARESGAIAVISQSPLLDSTTVIPVITVPHARRALGIIAHALHQNPSHDLTVIGVTGTNGKSSTVTMIQHLLQSSGIKTACFGTLGYTVGGETREAPHTTPFNEDLAELFAEARDAGDTHVVMEVSSHALEQERVAGIEFNVALFTNLTQDHLDYHETMEAYCEAKLKLFSGIQSKNGLTISNADDPTSERFSKVSKVKHYTFGKTADLAISDIKMEGNKSNFTIKSEWGSGPFEMGLLGQHNVSNIAGSITTCSALGVPFSDLQNAVASMPPVPGRFESIDCGQPFQVIVDYAHTDDGLRNVLIAAREVCTGRIITLFGCGGDRDKTKRPKMATVVAERSDFAIITSDNPRSESPELILMDIEVGMQHAGKKRDADYVVIESRKQAIHAALKQAKEGDLVMIAGKGHEDYQILNTGTIHFDDREEARDWLEANR